MAIAAVYFDGQSARAHDVHIALDNGRLSVRGNGIERNEALADLHVSEPMGAAPRLLKFADGAHCEIRDHAGFAALLAEGGHRDGWVVHMQRQWGWALIAVVISVLAVAAGYRWGLPAVSSWLAFQMPDRLLSELGDSTLGMLDDTLFEPSKLPAQRQQALAGKFAALAAPNDNKPAYRLVYRDSPRIGPNALALPDGAIVMTDQLVELAGNDEEILAVLAHELGHLDRRHSLRMLIQSSIVGIVAAWYLGDVSNIAAGLPTMLLEAGYSREHEREADEYAAGMLTFNGIPPARLGDLLARLEAEQGGAADQEDRNALDYLASHPATRERIEALRNRAR